VSANVHYHLSHLYSLVRPRNYLFYVGLVTGRIVFGRVVALQEGKPVQRLHFSVMKEPSCEVSSVHTTTVHGAYNKFPVSVDWVLDLTNNYRWKILGLTETSPTEIAWLTSQHVLDQRWQTSTRNSSSGISTTTISKNNTGEWVQYACQECGFLLHPGWRGTMIRSSGREDLKSQSTRQTMRRREQRKRHQAARVKQVMAKDSSTSRASSSSSSSKQITITDDSSRRLQLLESSPKINLLDRNHLVISCGRCHAKYYLKGPGQYLAPNITRACSADIKTISTQKMNISEGKRDAAWRGNLDGNFVVLPQSSKNDKDMNSGLSTKHKAVGSLLSSSVASISALSTPQLTLLERRQQERFGNKKKKSKHIPAPKNQLLNFLSTLNDP
jgi:hypothetical protein